MRSYLLHSCRSLAIKRLLGEYGQINETHFENHNLINRLEVYNEIITEIQESAKSVFIPR